MLDEFIMMKKLEGACTYSDIENMTKAEREYLMYLIKLSEKVNPNKQM